MQTSRSYWLMESERVSSHLSVTHLHTALSMNVIVVNSQQTNEKRTNRSHNRIESDRSQQGHATLTDARHSIVFALGMRPIGKQHICDRFKKVRGGLFYFCFPS